MCIYDLYISINVYIILLHVTSLVKVLTNCFYMFVFYLFSKRHFSCSPIACSLNCFLNRRFVAMFDQNWQLQEILGAPVLEVSTISANVRVCVCVNVIENAHM